MSLLEESQYTDEIDGVIDGWLHHFSELEPAMASTLVYLTDVHHVETEGYSFLDIDYEVDWSGTMSSEAVEEIPAAS